MEIENSSENLGRRDSIKNFGFFTLCAFCNPCCVYVEKKHTAKCNRRGRKMYAKLTKRPLCATPCSLCHCVKRP